MEVKEFTKEYGKPCRIAIAFDFEHHGSRDHDPTVAAGAAVVNARGEVLDTLFIPMRLPGDTLKNMEPLCRDEYWLGDKFKNDAGETMWDQCQHFAYKGDATNHLEVWRETLVKLRAFVDKWYAWSTKNNLKRPILCSDTINNDMAKVYHWRLVTNLVCSPKIPWFSLDPNGYYNSMWKVSNKGATVKPEDMVTDKPPNDHNPANDAACIAWCLWANEHDTRKKALS